MKYFVPIVSIKDYINSLKFEDKIIFLQALKAETQVESKTELSEGFTLQKMRELYWQAKKYIEKEWPIKN